MADPPAPELISERPGSLIWWLEDDRDLCRLLAARLRRCGWRLTLFHRAAELRRAIQLDEPDLLLLGRRLGSSDGLDLLADLRQHGHNFPVLILSALAEPHQRIEGLAVGANDYLSKPFHLAELIWRLERLLQAAPPRLLRPSPQRRPIPIGPLTLEPARALLRPAGGREGLPLSRGDLALLLAFLSAPGLVLSREHLAQATGSLVDPSTSRTLDMRLSRLRRLLQRLGADAVRIEAVRGHGYRLALSDAAPEGPGGSGGRDSLPGT
jgi:DNA-binding response OmpR family regulator